MVSNSPTYDREETGMKLSSILYYSQVAQRLKSEQIRKMADNLLDVDGNCAGIRPDDSKYVVCPDCPLRVHTLNGVMCLHAFDPHSLSVLRKIHKRDTI